jgi:PleD family two-component response regulator
MGIGTWAAQHAGILLAITVASLLAGAALMGMVLRLRARGRKLGARLAQASTELETLAVRDRLTGLRSREDFVLALDEACAA